MRALQVTEARKLAEADLPDPEPGAGEVTVEIAFCGICGSDLHMLPSPGDLAGHRDGARVLRDRGRDRRRRGGLVSRRPGLRPARNRLRRVPDRARPATSTSAPRRRSAATASAGARAPTPSGSRVDAESLFALPDGVSDEHGALVEPLAVGVHAVRLAAADAADPVCVLGAGPIGVMTSLALRAEGFERVVVVEPGESRRAKIEALGFDAVPLDGVHEAVIGAFGGELPAAVLECAGHPSALGLALELVRPRGTAVAVGVLEEPVPVNQLLLILKEARRSAARSPTSARTSSGRSSCSTGEGSPRTSSSPRSSRSPALRRCSRSCVRPGTEQLKVLLKP